MARLRREQSDQYDLDPNESMLAAYYLSGPEAVRDGVRVIEYTLDAGLDSWLLYEALGDFRAAVGDTAHAIEAYERARVTVPGRTYLERRIRELRGVDAATRR